MENILIVSGSERAQQLLCGLLKDQGAGKAACVGSGNQARRRIIERPYDLVLIAPPLLDEYGSELALVLSEATAAGIILLVKHDQADAIAEKVELSGVCVVALPTNRAALYQAVKLTLASRNRMLHLQRENQRLQSKIEEIRLVDRAKCMLIQYRGMTEPQAHRYIEKQAMDRRVTRGEVARNLLRIHEQMK